MKFRTINLQTNAVEPFPYDLGEFFSTDVRRGIYTFIAEGWALQRGTGFEDVTGKPIFEGDIIELDERDGTQADVGIGWSRLEKAIVCWDDDLGGWGYRPITDGNQSRCVRGFLSGARNILVKGIGIEE